METGTYRLCDLICFNRTVSGIGFSHSQTPHGVLPLRRKYTAATIVSNNNMPVSWCSSASHSKGPNFPATIFGLASTVKMPRTTCVNTKTSARFLTFVNRGERLKDLPVY